MLDGVREGLSNAEIADLLGVSVNTVRYHVSNMLTKVGVPDRQALAAWEGAPAVEVRRHHGLLALARIVGLAAALLVGAVLVWIALDRLSGTSAEVPASPPEATATAEGEEAFDPLARDVPFVSDGRYWARAVVSNGSTGLSSPAVVVRPDGTIVFVATVGQAKMPAPPVDVGGPPLAMAGRDDIVLGALAADGTHLWSRLIGGPGYDYMGDIALAEDGDILVSGTFEDGMDFGGGSTPSAGGYQPGSVGARDAFVARFDPDGDLRWAKTFGWEGRDDGGAVEVLPDGDIVITLTSSATELHIGTTRLESPEGELSAVVRLTSDGDVMWARAISDATSLGSLCLDQEGNLLMTTRIRTRIDGQRVSGVDGLLKLSSDGEPIWRTTFDGIVPWATTVALAPDDSIVIGGAFVDGPVDFGGGVLAPGEGDQGLLARFASDGTFESATFREDGIEALVVDGSGDIWIAGGDDTTVSEAYIERLDADGNSEAYLLLGPPQPAWGPWGPAPEQQQQTRGSSLARLHTLIVDSAATGEDEVLIAGRFQSRLVLPFDERLLSSYWLPHFIARVETP